MIKLVYTGECSGCDCADLELDFICTTACGGKCWYVQCKHAAACERMKRGKQNDNNTGKV